MPKAKTASTNASDAHDTLVPDPIVANEFGISLMTIYRWDRDENLKALGWPGKVQIRNRNFRSRRGLEKFKLAAAKRRGA